MDKLSVKLVDKKSCSTTLHVEIPASEVSQEAEKVYVEIQKNAQVPGFRVGKAPLDYIKKNYSVSARERVIENLIQRSLLPALKEHKIEPVSYPRIEKVSFDFVKPFSFDIYAEIHPEVKAKNYKGIKIKKEILPVTEAKVKENLESLRERNARLVESKAEAATDKHFLLLDYDAFAEGQHIIDLSAKNQLIDLSSPQTIAGFKEGLVGAKKGENREIKVKFPEAHPNKKVANKEVVFKASVNEIKEKSLPALDDELAKDFGIGSLNELENKVKETMETEEKHRQEQDVEKQIVDHLIAENKFDVPESLVEEQLQYMLSRALEYFKRQGLPQSAWEKNLEQLKVKYRQEAERAVRLSYIFKSIAQEEKIEVTEDDLSKEHKKLHEGNPGKDAEVEKYFNENKDKIASHLKEEKLFNFIIAEAKVKEEVKV